MKNGILIFGIFLRIKFFLIHGLILVFIATYLSSCIDPVEPIEPVVYETPLQISGYTDKTSYATGETVLVYISADKNYDHGIIRLFDVNGKQVDKIITPLKNQMVTNSEPWKNGLGYAVSFEYSIPFFLRSGLYFWENQIPFIVKSVIPGKVIIVYPSNTINAYTKTQSVNLYTKNVTHVSFYRPQNIAEGYVLPFLKWVKDIESEDWSYICDRDLDDDYYLSGAKLLIIAGHNEYWTRKGRENFDAFVDHGGHAMVLSGNTMWWQVRFEMDALICYKLLKDPVNDPMLQTKLWNDPTLNYPIMASIGADFDHGGYGLKVDRGWNGYKITQPGSPLFAGLNLNGGEIISLPTGEYDGAPLKGFSSEGVPIIDQDLLGFNKVELLGYDFGFRGVETVGTFIVFQKTPTSGIVINAGSNHWCTNYGIGAGDGKVKKITWNMLDILLNDKPVFTP